MLLLQEYNQFQVKQLTKLIEVTRTDLKKEDRQKVMNMITIDAHSRDMVESIAESGIDRYTHWFGIFLGVHHAICLPWRFVCFTVYSRLEVCLNLSEYAYLVRLCLAGQTAFNGCAS